MPNPVAANDLSPISGSLQTSRISYGVETAGKNYGQNYNGSNWYSDIPNNGQFYTIISDNYTANYYVSRSNAGGAYVEGGLPAVDEYSAPVFWITPGTSSLDVITIVNGLPDRVGQTPFNSGSQALNWVASSSNYFAVGPDYYAQIDADQLQLYLDANQIISYPTTQSTWYDLSGNTKNGILENGLGTSWNSNGYFDFDGSDDDVNLGPTNTLYSGSNISWEVLFNSDSTSGYRALFGNGSASPPYIALHLNVGSMQLRFEAAPGAGPFVDSVLATATINRWQHFIVTYDGTIFRSYLNGVATGTTSFTQALGNNTQTFYIGRFWAGVFNGLMEKFRIYQKTLSAADAAQNYYGGPIVTNDLYFMLDAGNLVSYPKSGTTAYDLLNNVNGTLTNGPTFNPTFGGCWNFDGTDDYIKLGSSITPGNGNWTLSAWVRGFGGVVGNTSGGPVASGFGIFSTGGNYKIFYANYDGAWNYNYGNTTLDPNEWYFLTWVNYDSQQMKMYVNGISDSSVFNSLTSNGGPVDAVGGTQGTPGGTFNGNIVSVQWNIDTAFTDAQVLQNYNATH